MTPGLKTAQVFFNRPREERKEIWSGDAILEDDQDLRRFKASTLLALAHRWAYDNKAIPKYEPPDKVVMSKDGHVIGIFTFVLEDALDPQRN